MIRIQKLEKKHLEECTQLYIDVFNGAPWNDAWTVETASKRLGDIYDAPNFVGILLQEEDKIKGAVFGNYEQFYDGIHYNLREMFVDSRLQGNGMGSRMFRELEPLLKEHDVTTIILFTSKGNLTSKFYLKNGFEEYDSMAMMGKDL